jgi:SAM-dependent methyltransferase
MDKPLADRQSLLKFIEALSTRQINIDSPPFRRHLAQLMESEGVDYQSLFVTAMRALRLWPPFRELLDDADRTDADAIQQKLRLPQYLETLDDPLVHRLLRGTVVGNLTMERLLTILRRTFLERGEHQQWELTPGHNRFMASLACQCFNNEYVYAAGPEELEAVERLATRLRQSEDASLAPEGLIVFAMYAPLWTLGLSDRLLRLPESYPDLQELVTRQVRDRIEEEEILKTVPSFGMSDELITGAVRQQYEESPYPRWLNISIGLPVRFADAMQKRFPFLPPAETGRPVRILVAGCGTGVHPIQVATQYSDVRIVAIDISKASLAYGIRQARRHGLSNIEFIHGDILCVDRLGMRFDAVESVGVLHHLADPEAGLRALADVLLPGGLMKLGLYSRRARAGLEDARSWIASQAGRRTPGELRELRQEVIARVHPHQPENQMRPASFLDFYYLSGFRDMLCHTREVQFTPGEVQAVLRRLDLSFLGYRGLNAEIRAAYVERFPMDPEIRDLDLVEQFEPEHPEMFQALQFFWVFKKPANG